MALDLNSIILIILAVLVILYVIKMSFELRPSSQDCGKRCVSGLGPNEPFVASTDYQTGSEYDGQVLGVEKKMMPLDVGKVYTPQGTPNALRPSGFVPDVYPSPSTSVDGGESSPNSMFMFAYNQCKPECCPSTYSCSGGCVCVTQAQSEYIANRGNNNTIPQYAML